MHIIKCPGCGWEFPENFPARHCKFCGARFTSGFCSTCKQWTDKLHPYDHQCKACVSARSHRWYVKRKAMHARNLEEWLEKIKAIPTPYKTLTEAEWNEACRYFNGCAICGRNEIDARHMFIDFAYGGRYCAWNIIPACEKCETAFVGNRNPFNTFDHTLNTTAKSVTVRLGCNKERLNVILDYLERRFPK